MKYKFAGDYVIYLNTEFRLATFRGKRAVLTTINQEYQDSKFGFSLYTSPHNDSEKVYIKEVEVTELSNAYDLHYEADYQGERFLALVDPNNPQITLHTGDEAIARKFGFRNYSKGEWVKDIDISEIELIPVKEPIDLSTYLPTN